VSLTPLILVLFCGRIHSFLYEVKRELPAFKKKIVKGLETQMIGELLAQSKDFVHTQKIA